MGTICWRDVIKRGLYSTSLLIIGALYGVVNRYTGREKELTTYIDNVIPFNRYFIYAYVAWYLYMVIFITYFCIFDEKRYYKILIGINAGMLISFFIYLIFPTTVPRPVFNHGDGLTGQLFDWLYHRDNPYNCFPSIHVINTLIIAIYVHRDNMHINRFAKAASLFTAVLIIYSTLAIKQHVLMDAVSAAGISYGLYGIMDYKEIFARLKNSQRISET